VRRAYHINFLGGCQISSNRTNTVSKIVLSFGTRLRARQTLACGPRTLEADVRLDDEADALLLDAGGQRVEVVQAQRQTEVRHLSFV